MTISLLVAMSDAGVIGRNGQLPWRLSADLRRFRRLTTGHAIVMGRKTFESIGRPLPERMNIVVTRQRDFSPPAGVVVTHDIDAALKIAREMRPVGRGNAGVPGHDDEVFVVGGAEIYRQTLGMADRIYLTLVHADVAGDARFDAPNPVEWREVERTNHPADDKNEYPYSFLLLERRRN